MTDYKKHLIRKGASIVSGLKILNDLAADAVLFVVDEDEKLIGSLTDGDIRRGVLKGLTLEDSADKFALPNPKFLPEGNHTINDILFFRANHISIIPVLNAERKITSIVNLRFLKSYLPIDAVIMAGGRGERLSPLTDATPKPLLKIGDEAIIEHNLNRLASFGINKFWISLGYLGEQVEDYFKKVKNPDLDIQFIWEEKPLGTIGAVSKIAAFHHDYVLITNSDLLTNIDYEHFFLHFLEHEADVAIVSIPYQVSVPYGVLNIHDNQVISLKEKPNYTYYTNGGIYLMKKEMLAQLPDDTFFNATDLIERLIKSGKKVVSYPLAGYWLDVGKPEDFVKAQHDIHHIKF